MALKGFDPKWKDFPDYIIGITREIWEERGIASLNHYYAKDIPMRFPSGLVQGNEAVIQGTLATLAEFPDRQLLGEDVIWSGNENEGFLSSHRILSTGTHLGDGYFGPATGKCFTARAIADCAARDNTIYDEWLIRDSGAIVRQLGMEPMSFARDLIAREGGPDNCVMPFTPDQDIDGGYRGRGNDNESGLRLAEILTRISEARRRGHPGAIRPRLPDRTSGRPWRAFLGHSRKILDGPAFVFPLREVFEIHHQIGREDPMLPPRAAIRWSLTGKHDGYGLFGAPSGAAVHIMGFSHAEFGPWGLRREFTLFDEISIWKQILLHTG